MILVAGRVGVASLGHESQGREGPLHSGLQLLNRAHVSGGEHVLREDSGESFDRHLIECGDVPIIDSEYGLLSREGQGNGDT